jgi:antioxidant, ahpC/TSA family
MRNYFLYLFLFLTWWGRSQNFTLDGNISTPYEGKIYLWYGDKVDSTTVNNKEFHFQGNIAYPMKASLSVNRKFKETGFFILDKGDLSLDIAIENKRQVYIKSLNGSQTLNEVKNFLLFRTKSAKAANLPELLTARLEQIIRKDPKSQFAGMLLSELLTNRDISYKQAQRLYSLLDKNTQDKEDLQRIEVLLSAMSKTQVGSTFPDIELSTEKGTEKLSAVRKKLTLVNFTASDCIACVEADRQFGNLFKEYHRSHGFTIYSIYLDNDRNTWIDHLHREGIRWTSTIAPRKFKEETIQSLGIIDIPANFLLDEQGKIIAVNISPKGVHRILDPKAAALVPVPKKEKKGVKKTSPTRTSINNKNRKKK